MYLDHQSFESREFNLYDAWCLARVSYESYEKEGGLPSVLSGLHFNERYYDLNIPLDRSGFRTSHLRGFLGSYHITSKSAIILIAFRGTHDLAGFLTDFSCLPCSIEEEWGFKGKIHKGFKQSAENFYSWALTSELWCIDDVKGTSSLKQLIIENLVGIRSDRFILTGHSLGGAVATCVSSLLVSEYLRNAYDFPYQLNQLDAKSYTFGAPPVGDQTFVTELNASFTQHRIVHEKDPILKIPFYKHYGEQHVLTEYVEHSSHKMLNYMNILECKGGFNRDDDYLLDYV